MENTVKWEVLFFPGGIWSPLTVEAQALALDDNTRNIIM